MKKWTFPAVAGFFGAVAFALRKQVYAGAVDGKNLIVSGHPVVIALWVLTVLALALAAVAAWRQKGSALFAENFSAHAPAFLGHGMLGVSMVLTVALNPMPMPGLLGMLWKGLGWISPVCLLLAGWQRMQGKQPFFALYAAPCLFFAAHVVNHYQLWCSNPQFTDYAFALLGAVSLSLFTYQQAAFGADCGNRRSLTFWGLAAVYLCGAELAGSLYPYLYLGGILFCLTGLPKQNA